MYTSPILQHDRREDCVLRETSKHPELGLFEDFRPAASPSELQVFSFFSGAGFLDLGFEETSFGISYVNELNTEFLEGYQRSRQSMSLPEPTCGYSSNSVENYLDVTKRRLTSFVQSAKKDAIVGFIGGPPCPDFSVAGKNRGSEGDNGKLTEVYFELIKAQKPDWFLFENVKGLWSTNRHREFYNKMLSEVHGCGYYTTDRLINALDFGAPQDRQRVICVGVADHIARKLGLSKKSKIIEDGVFPWRKFMRPDSDQLLGLPWPTTNEFGENTSPPEGIPLELTVQYWFDQNMVSVHPNAFHQFKPRAGLAKFETVREGDDSRKSYKRLHRHRYSPTACYGNNEVHLHPTLPRRISVAEALAIQSLPRGFALPEKMSLSAMFKTVGNGVPFLAARGLARTIHDFILPAIK